jgi:hypothetical protein
LDDGYQVTSGSGSGCEGAVIIASGITVIGTDAFINASSMTSVQIPNTVIEIGSNSFAGSGLTSINIPGSVMLMGDAAFQQMGSLTTVVIQDGITSLPTQAFYNNFNKSIVNLSLPNSLITIGDAAFFGAGISTLEIPDSVTSIGSQAFSETTNLTNLSLGSSLTSIGSFAFYLATSLTSVTIPNSVVTIGEAAFQNASSINSLNLGNSLTAIDDYAFFNSGITDLYIPNSVDTIGDYAFDSSVNLSRVEIGSGVTTIGVNAFSNTNLLRLGEDSQKVQTVFYCGDPVAGGFFIDMDVLEFLYDLPSGADALAINAAPPPICSGPAAPDLTAASASSDSSVGLTFTAPTFTGGAPVTAYEVSIRNPTGEVVLFTQSFTPTPAIERGASSTLTVTNLTPATTYGFSLQAINALDGSYQSFLLTATTRNDAAQAAAEAARVVAAAEAARQATAAAAAKQQKELTEILSIIPNLGALALTLGETTKSLTLQRCVKKKEVRFVKKGTKCPRGFVRK